MWLKANVPENDIRLVRVGQEIEVQGGRRSRSRVQGAHHRHRRGLGRGDAARGRALGDPQSRTARSSRRCSPPSRSPPATASLTPGVPVEAVIRDGDVASVWVEREPMLFERRKVKLGIGAGRPPAGARGPQARRTGRRARRHLRRQRVAAMSARLSGADAAMLRSLIAFCLSRRPLVLIASRPSWRSATRRSRRSTSRPIPTRRRPSSRSSRRTRASRPRRWSATSRSRSRSRVASTPGLKFIRSNTVYALSFIRLQFEYGRDYYFVRQQTINRLKDATLPARRAARDLAGRRHQRDLALRAARAARTWT